MNTWLWVGQIFLAAIFFYSGVNKSVVSQAQLIAKGQTGVEGLSAGIIRFIGISEILGAFGIFLPRLVDVLPWLTPVAALCFAVLMVLAAWGRMIR